MAIQATLQGLQGDCGCDSADAGASGASGIVQNFNFGSQDSSQRFSRDDHGSLYSDSSGKFDASGRLLFNQPTRGNAPGGGVPFDATNHEAAEIPPMPPPATRTYVEPPVKVKRYAEFY